MWRLQIPAGPSGKYRLSQVDDYRGRARRNFPWQPPFRLELQARASDHNIPGTWGFGLWNDPFGMAILSGVDALRLPALPNTAWFFFASPENYLSLRDDLPAHGALAAAFRAPHWPPPVLLLGFPVLPLMLFPAGVRLLRRLVRQVVRQDAVRLQADPTEWLAYRMEWVRDRVIFRVDDETILESRCTPQGNLGLVIWVDNQYAALSPDGRVGFGTLANPEPAWIEIRRLRINGEEVEIDREN